MTDTNEIRALKASLRGCLAAGETLAALQQNVDAFDDHGDVAEADLDELARVTLAHAVASQALRGLVVTMRNRRSAPAE